MKEHNIYLTPREKAWLMDHPEITIAFDGQYAPYSFQDESEDFHGIAVDFANELAARAGLKLNIYKEGNWQKLYAAAQSREVDVIATLVLRPERHKHFKFTTPYISLAQFIITRKDYTSINNKQDIAGKTLALVKGYSTTKHILENYLSVTPLYVKNLSDALDAVSTGKADATVIAMGMAQHLIAQKELINLKFAAIYGQGLSEQRFGIRKDWPELASILQKALDSLTEEERLKLFLNWTVPEVAKVEKVLSNLTLDLTTTETNWLSEHKEIQIGVMDAWPPFNFVDKDGVPQGIGSDLIREINRRLNGVLKVVPGAWNQIYEDAKGNRLDALMDITPKKSREKFFNFTTPYLDIPHVIIAPKDVPFIRDEEDLYDKTLALERNFGNVEYFRNKYPEVNLKLYRDTEHAIGAVARGEADAYAGNRGVAIYIMEQEVIGNLKVHGRLSKSGSILAIGTHKDNLTLHRILQKALNNITNEEKHLILNKWVHIEEENVPSTIQLTKEEAAWLTKYNVIRVGLDPKWAPVEFIDKSGNYKGISVEYLNKIEEITGIKFEYAYGKSWEQMIEMVNYGELDFLASVKRTPQRDKFLDFTDSYISFPLVIFAQQDQQYLELEALNGKKVAVVRGYAAHEILMNNHPDIVLITADTTVDALKLLANGKVSAFVDNLLTTSYYIGELGYSQIKVAGDTQYSYNQTMGVRKDWPLLKSILQKSLNMIPKEEQNAIKQKWISVKYEHGFDYSIFWKVVGSLLLFILFLIYLSRKLSSEVKRRTEELSNANLKLSSSLNEKEILLREVHHRVHNNMAIISSLLSLESKKIKDKQMLEKIIAIKSRIQSMALVYEKLHLEDNFSEINVQSYIDSLVISILSSFGIGSGYSIEKDIDNIDLNIDILIPCGLIMNEIITNAIRHAFDGINSPEIKVSMKKADKNIILVISDNGVGLPEGFDIKKTSTLGLHLVDLLSTQIQGTLEIKLEDGTEFRLVFPETIDIARYRYDND
ncbi:transporter substrate-binding domain-containing protein [Nitrospirota bacterium]